MVDALGALSVAPQIGISMVKPDCDAVTTKLVPLAAMQRLGVRAPKERNDPAFCTGVHAVLVAQAGTVDGGLQGLVQSVPMEDKLPPMASLL